MNRLRKLFVTMIAIASTFGMLMLPVHADGYWTDGWWDDATQTWHDGYWTETSPSYNYSNYNGYTSPRYFTWYNQLSNYPTIIGSGNMRSNGCVPTAAAMLLSGYGIYVIPEDMGWYLYNTGNFDNWYGHGGSDLSWFDVANYAGLGAWTVYDYDSMVSALQNGSTIAAHIYAYGGTHAVLLTGYDNGMTTVYDSIGGVYQRSTSSIWNGRSFAWNDILSGNSIIAIG